MNAEQLELNSLFDSFRGRLARVASRQTSDGLRKRYDADDIVQSAFRTTWRRQKEGTVKLFTRAGALALLKKIVIRKAAMAARFHSAERRDPNREVAASLSRCAQSDPKVADQVAEEMLVKRLLDEASELEAATLKLIRQGHSVQQIAGELGVARQTIYRQIESLRKKRQKLEATISAAGGEQLGNKSQQL